MRLSPLSSGDIHGTTGILDQNVIDGTLVYPLGPKHWQEVSPDVIVASASVLVKLRQAADVGSNQKLLTVTQPDQGGESLALSSSVMPPGHSRFQLMRSNSR